MDNVRVHALVPVKDLGLAKTRLAAVLTAEERRDLARAMLEDVLAALLASPVVVAITLLSDDPVADILAASVTLWALRREVKRNLNGSIQKARLEGENVLV